MKKIYTRLVFLVAMAALFASCEKDQDEKDYSLEVIITAQDSVRAQNALVHVYAPVANSMIDYYKYTDEEGIVSFDFKNKAVLEIVAQKSPYKGCTFAELERGQTKVRLDMKLYNNENNGCDTDQ